jgi:hypothetical protein
MPNPATSAVRPVSVKIENLIKVNEKRCRKTDKPLNRRPDECEGPLFFSPVI